MTYVPRTEPRRRNLPKGGADGFDLDIDSFCRPADTSKAPSRKSGHARHALFVGVVKYFSSAQGYGLIETVGGGVEVFVAISAVEKAGLRNLRKGQQVCFNLAQNSDDRPAAVNLKRT